ncbi:hypothetical protein O181_007512 [Austropuccinia psidii MF-1]|uniref:Uncharacterized protein n=1 Tax=Austropuccinia psidii MF-1 TaxID=1389203 RepID=A0A9Q3BM30_9BASI|nr:hypothetical protein [Austropuccinia psidii MF-1]
MISMACDEIYAFSPLVHKEKFTGNHHMCASNPRKAHAILSREQFMNDVDDNMSSTQRKPNCEPRREDFMIHEEGTHPNGEFTNPQMALSQSLLNQL